jgi:tetratricopeptide (TPR) repeat protein
VNRACSPHRTDVKSRSKRTPSIFLLLLFGFSTCADPEEEASQLYSSAQKSVTLGQKSRATSYKQACVHYKDAIDKIEEIQSRYSSTVISKKLTSGEDGLGPYSYGELKKTVLPDAKSKAEAESSLLSCTLFVINRLSEDEIEDKVSALIDLASGLGLGDQKDKSEELLAQAFEEARNRGKKNSLSLQLDVAEACIEMGNTEKAAEILSFIFQTAKSHVFESGFQKTNFLIRVASRQAECKKVDVALCEMQSLPEDEFIKYPGLISEAVEVLESIAKQYVDSGFPAKALDALDVAIKLGKHATTITGNRVEIFVRLSLACENAGETTMASQLLSEAETLLTKKPSKISSYFIVDVLTEMGMAYLDYGKRDKAVMLFSKAFKEGMLQKRSSKVWYWNMSAIANGYLKAGDPENSLRVMQSAKYMDSEILMKHVKHYMKEGQLEKALATNEMLDDKAGVLLDIVQQLAMKNDLGAAQGIAQRAEALLKDEATTREGYYSALALASIHEQLGQKGNALEYLSLADKNILEKEDYSLHDQIWKIKTLLNIAKQYQNLGKEEKAGRCLERTLEIARGTSDTYEKAAMLVEITSMVETNKIRVGQEVKRHLHEIVRTFD